MVLSKSEYSRVGMNHPGDYFGGQLLSGNGRTSLHSLSWEREARG